LFGDTVYLGICIIGEVPYCEKRHASTLKYTRSVINAHSLSVQKALRHYSRHYVTTDFSWNPALRQVQNQQGNILFVAQTKWQYFPTNKFFNF